MSQLFVRTLREDPADAEVPSHRWLVRAGYIRRVAPGVYSRLPLGLRVMRRIEAICREEMASIGAQEVSFPRYSLLTLTRRPDAGSSTAITSSVSKTVRGGHAARTDP